MLKKMQQSENKFVRKLGFTLAETLIVIAIIGIIASIAIPTLFGTTSDAELKAAWKKSYSDLTQATQLIAVDNGGTLAGAFPGDAAGSEDLKNAFASKLNIIKDCSGTSTYGGTGTGASAEGCWHSTASDWFYLNGDDAYNISLPGLILNNGSLIFYSLLKSDCSVNVSVYDSNADYTRCGYLFIDVNGFKKPNTLGKDIFGGAITTNTFIPWGAKEFYDPSRTCIDGSTVTDNKGYGCSAKYLYE
ncbi:MAG: prepilin-type N-terminal cleavage/methylation domain-containing protein [Candidatus Gastranaerophilales bacterium]|nr:prepilin-type N-terminal cleavage/methylation domain-containing protein [Candidatus Gastranaerophilales bacterium]